MKKIPSWLLKTPKKSAFTIIELLIAMTMLSIIILVISTTVAQIYFQQKKITLRQNFHNESRFLMEKVVQLVRNNTLDYDTYFVELGPPDSCSGFHFNTTEPTEVRIPKALQEPACIIAPSDTPPNETICPLGYLYDIDSLDNEIGNSLPDGSMSEIETRHNRETLGYENIFYWDTDNDGVPDRQLGGFTPSGAIDPACTIAIDPGTTIQDLYLINGSRTVRTHLQYINDGGSDLDGDGEDCDPGECQLLLSRELGRDRDGDKRTDEWNSQCDTTTLGVPGDDPASDEGQRYCQKGHDLINITPDFLLLKDLSFAPSPDRDPYLASRVDFVQIQPHVFIDMSFEMRDPTRFRFAAGQGPNTRLQTSASSRVFGNTRY